MSSSPEPGAPAPDPAANPAPPEPAPGPPLPQTPLTFGQLAPGAIGLVAGLAWGAIMLIVLGFWIRSKNEPSTRILTNVFLIGGAVSAALAAWQAFTLWFKQESAEQKAAVLFQQRRILGYALLFGGLALVILAFFLGIGKRADGSIHFLETNLAESIGVVILGVIALASGYLLTVPPQETQLSVRSLVGMTPMLKLLFFILGALAFIGFIAIAYKYRTGYATWIPELAALLFLSVLCLSYVLWLNTGQLDEVGMRVFVLVSGGSFGCILFVYAIARAYLWRQDVVMGGIAAWQGANGWRFWLVAYVQIVALILMFVSFSFARTDIRSNATLRRLMYGYDAILQGLLLIEMLAVLNVVVYAVAPFTYDWSKTRGTYSLADSSKNLIAGLKKEVNVVVLMRPGNPNYRDLHNLLDNCQAINSTKFKVSYVSPETEPVRFEGLVKIFPKIAPETFGVSSGVLLVDGPIPEKQEDIPPPYAFVVERKLSDDGGGRGQKAKKVFKGEGEILKELKFLVQDKQKRKIYVLQGDGEADINNKEGADRGGNFDDTFSKVGIGFFVDRLAGDGYDVTGVSFHKDFGKALPNVKPIVAEGGKKDIPADCETLIIPGISTKLPDDALEGIQRYLERGGKLIAFFDVVVNDDYTKMIDTGLEGVLAKGYGVNVTNEFPLRVPLSKADDVRAILAYPPRGSSNPLAREFSRAILMKRTARVVKPAETPGRFKAETILEAPLSAERRTFYTLESKVGILQNPQIYMLGRGQKLEAAIQEKPISMAVAVTEEPGDKPRMVIFGDTEFITNFEIARSPTAAVNYSFVVSSIEWLGGREDLIGIQPRESDKFALPVDVNYARMIFLPGWIMFLGLIGLGIGVWMVRRR